jgi:large subunit ribosomal protein L3
MAGIIGIKIGMVNLFDDSQSNMPCTVIKADPCQIVRKKTIESDGYLALQIGFGERKEKHTTKPLLGHFKKNEVSLKKKLREFRISSTSYLEKFELGKFIDVDFFSQGDSIIVRGNSKGKGFQGVVKRWGFRGVGDASHGQHNRLRAPGSIGACATPSRVFKGMKMAGKTGNKKIACITKIIKIDKGDNLLIVKGSIPGPIGSCLNISLRNL